MNRLALRLKGISRHAPSAADLKFLHRLRQTHFRNFKSKRGTRIICLLVPLLLPKFVSESAAMYHELRKRGTWVYSRDDFRAHMMRAFVVLAALVAANSVAGRDATAQILTGRP